MMDVQPFLKWPGGKRWLAADITRAFPDGARRYVEPFVGGGAVFFRYRPASAVLADSNAELINVFRMVQTREDALIAGLRELAISRDEFHRIRAWRPRGALQRAVRFIYLNKTAFNGMYRVNRQGEFNVPFGCKPGTVLCDEPVLRAASETLRGCDLVVGDFEEVMDRAGARDLIYADPPYTVKHDNNGFRRYNEKIFSWDDQIRLADAARRAVTRGASVVVSNAHHDELLRLYEGFQASELQRTSCISGKTHARGRVREYLFVGRPR